MTDAERTSHSKFLSLVLRHRPDLIGVTLDAAGWVEISALLAGCAAQGRSLSRAALEEIVRTSPKQRFECSEDGTRLRARQGHSVAVELGYEPQTPPHTLFHGTVATAIPSIRAQGLLKRKRHHVHLSPDRETATIVGRRRGAPLLLIIDASGMAAAGHTFYLSTNGVWLTDHVPPAFITFPE